MSKIIYIAGLGHSGSTILDLSLGTLPGVTGLGELKTLMDDRSRSGHYTSVCSCGKMASECIIWKGFPALMEGKMNYEEKIEAVLDLLRSVYGSETTMVDSSKNSYGYLEYIKKKHDLKLVFLTRDVRSWSYSRHLSTGKPLLYYVLRWWLENLKLLSQLKRMRIDYLRIGYEEMALYPEYVLKKITRFSGLGYTDAMLTPGMSKSHIISGNVARADKLKNARWTYDARWMVSGRILAASPLLLLIHRLNRRLVYSNICERSVKDFYMFGSTRKMEMHKKYN
ncbi:MAG: sulfotransferase [Bacteroidales bacterium]|nr:sulfotransferase [Bacteroidales bacterium]